MTQPGFKAVGQTEQRLFGPRKILVCGYVPEQQLALLDIYTQLPDFKTLPILFARPEDADYSLENLFTREPDTAPGEVLASPPAIIMAGLTEKELHLFMAAHKKTMSFSPIWATLTPTSAGWPLKDLLKELGREKEAMHKRHGNTP